MTRAVKKFVTRVSTEALNCRAAKRAAPGQRCALGCAFLAARRLRASGLLRAVHHEPRQVRECAGPGAQWGEGGNSPVAQLLRTSARSGQSDSAGVRGLV